MVSRVTGGGGKSTTRNSPLDRRGKRFAEVHWVADTGSTNADLLAVVGGEQVLVADHQRAGRGRLDRRWEAPPGANLLVSVRVVPAAPLERWAQLTGAMALAVTDVVAARGVAAAVRWPNDVMVGDRKLAGILAELPSSADAAVVGVGLNVAWPATDADAPGLNAVSLVQLGVFAPRDELLDALLDRFAYWVLDVERGRDTIVAALRERSATLGRNVKLQRVDGQESYGIAVAIDDEGRIVVESGGTRSAFSVAEVTHLR